MKSNLKLVASNGKRVCLPRPIECDYTKRGGEWHKLKITHSTSINCAIAAATKRLLAKEYEAGAIYNKHGDLVIVVRRVRGNIVIEDCTPTKNVLR